MARKPSKPKLVISNDGDELLTAAEARARHPKTPLEVALAIAAERKEDEAEAARIVAEHGLSPRERATSRWRRKANEGLCQAIESDPRFVEAMERAMQELVT